jgi:membrane protein DedA with SNARE-associated domain
MILLARLLPGLRTIFFLGAGAGKMPVRRFLAYDLAGAALASMFWPWLGFRFHDRITRILAWSSRLHGPLALIAIAGLATFLLHRASARRHPGFADCSPRGRDADTRSRYCSSTKEARDDGQLSDPPARS